ncbi:hypothetical protein JZ751_024776 [Albula glossodonta]|uniref:VWFD domain-containing protein n=1 Tax=Albula glossodonta TaxID=121402 RepID=A0A8T2PMH5_9TELE|nr:hypothetical protein JZ751_024776 [Albula glossodonta]
MDPWGTPGVSAEVKHSHRLLFGSAKLSIICHVSLLHHSFNVYAVSRNIEDPSGTIMTPMMADPKESNKDLQSSKPGTETSGEEQLFDVVPDPAVTVTALAISGSAKPDGYEAAAYITQAAGKHDIQLLVSQVHEEANWKLCTDANLDMMHGKAKIHIRWGAECQTYKVVMKAATMHMPGSHPKLLTTLQWDNVPVYIEEYGRRAHEYVPGMALLLGFSEKHVKNPEKEVSALVTVASPKSIDLKIKIPEKGTLLIDKSEDGIIVHAPTLGLHSLFFDGKTIKVVIESWMRGKTCGLCGLADGETKTEFRKPNSKIAKSPSHFLSSWVLQGEGCSDACSLRRHQVKLEKAVHVLGTQSKCQSAEPILRCREGCSPTSTARQLSGFQCTPLGTAMEPKSIFNDRTVHVEGFVDSHISCLCNKDGCPSY